MTGSGIPLELVEMLDVEANGVKAEEQRNSMSV